MGKYNISRLKEKIGFSPNEKDVDIYFELIDNIYYKCQTYVEDFNENTEVTTWFFDNGRRISLDIIEITILSLFLLDLYYDVDEQLKPLSSLEASYFLEENSREI